MSVPTVGTIPPRFPHQEQGVEWLLDRPERFALVGDQMRVGKTRQAIDATQELYTRVEVDRAIVVAPPRPRIEWADPDPSFGQVARYSTVPVRLTEYKSGRSEEWTNSPCDHGAAPCDPAPLEWIVTNYEFMRRKNRLEPLLQVADRRTVLVLDESSAVSNFRSQQSRACQKLAAKCGWVWLLNGTPEGEDPEDQFGQFYVMDWRVIGCRYISEFRARYAIMNPWITRDAKVKTPEGWRVQKVPVQVERWTNLDDLAKRTAPHVMRRTCEQVFPDMPPRLPPSTVEVPLGKDAWRVYQAMKRDAVAWLDANRTATAAQAGVKILRLAQITSGFVGGVECERCLGSGSTHVGDPCDACGGMGSLEPQEVGREKLDAVVSWVKDRLIERPDFKVILWCRFRPEAHRMAETLAELLPVLTMMGGQSKAERDAAQRAVHPQTAEPGALGVVGTAGTGAKGLNMAAASDMVFASNAWSLMIREQSSFRIVGPDQTRPASYLDVLATGPKGEPTVDHAVVKRLREKQDVARMTAEAWLKELKGR